MFITVLFSRETRKTRATSEKVATLEKSRRRDRNALTEAMAAVTATANQNREAAGSVQINKASVAPNSASALATVLIRHLPGPGMDPPP
jgi:hypothetical protein